MDPSVFDEPFEALNRFCARYRADAAVRARIARGDTSDLGLELPAGTEVRIVEQTADTFYFPLPPEPAAAVADEMLNQVSGGGATYRAHGLLGPSNPCMPVQCVLYPGDHPV